MDKSAENIVGKLFVLRALMSVLSLEYESITSALRNIGLVEQNILSRIGVNGGELFPAVDGKLSVRKIAVEESPKGDGNYVLKGVSARYPGGSYECLDKLIRKFNCFGANDRVALRGKVAVAWFGTEEAKVHFTNKLGELHELFDEVNSKLVKERKHVLRMPHKVRAYEEMCAACSAEIKRVFDSLNIYSKMPLIQKDLADKEQMAKNSIARCEVLYKTTVAAFSDMVDKKNWENIDLLINYFETERATTMKEALMYVDIEKQAMRIAEALSEATKQKRNNISTGLLRLEKYTQDWLVREVTDATTAQGSAILQIVSAEVLHSSMLAKSKVSGIELMRDIDRLIEYFPKTAVKP